MKQLLENWNKYLNEEKQQPMYIGYEPNMPGVLMAQVLDDSQWSNVVSKSMEGNADNSKGLKIYVDARSIINENVMLNAKRISSSIGGRGITINIRIATTAIAIRISLFFVTNGI